MSVFDMQANTSIETIDASAYTFDAMVEVFKLFKAQPKVYCGPVMDSMWGRLGVRKTNALAPLGGLDVQVDPWLPPNTIRFDHPDGRKEIFTISPEGKIFRIDMSALEKFEMPRVRHFP